MPTTERKIGRYVLLEPVGRGAMGVVYRAEDPTIHRTVAVKVLHTRNGLSAQEIDLARHRFEREGQSAGSIDHPNIIKVFDVGEDVESGEMYIVMEFVDGPNLETILANAAIEPAKAATLIRQIASGLDAAHARGIIHRDVKPSNILLTADGTPKIVDFGLTHIAASALTQDMRELGTPAYMSPEQVSGKTLDSRADLFALGVLSYEILAGRRPFAGGDIVSLAHAIAYASPPPISSANPELPKGLDAVMERILSKEPSDRFKTGEEFVDALLPHLTVPVKNVPKPPDKVWSARPYVGLALAAALTAIVVVTSWRRGTAEGASASGAAPSTAAADTIAQVAPPPTPSAGEKARKPAPAKKPPALMPAKPVSAAPAAKSPVPSPKAPPAARPVEPRPAVPNTPAVAAPVSMANVTIRFAYRLRRGTLVVFLDGKPIFDEKFSKSKLAMVQTTIWDPLKAPAGGHTITARVDGDDGKSFASDSYAVEFAKGQDVELRIGLKGDTLTVKKADG